MMEEMRVDDLYPYDHIVLAPSKGYPPFKLNESRFNQSTFYGRWRHFLDVIDPMTLLTTSKKLNESIQLLDDFKKGSVHPRTTDAQLWQAKKVKQALLHPDTGEKIFMPFRMSGFVPFGTPMVVGMLLPSPTFAQTVVWQWLNQSHNACVNYANRNATKPTPLKRFILGYVGAVTCAVGIAVGLTKAISRIRFLKEPTKLLMKRFVPFPAVATASTCNVVLMRNSELYTGIEVCDKCNNTVGTSRVAAKKALLETAISRVVLASPILLLPPMVMRALEKRRFLQTYPRLHLPLNALVCTVVFGGALPIAIAVFPQISTIKKSRLEKDVQDNMTDEVAYYNKGL